jgi:hypothetical protein
LEQSEGLSIDSLCIAASNLHEYMNNVDDLGKCCSVYLYLPSVRVILSAFWTLFQNFLSSCRHLITFVTIRRLCIYIPPCSVIVDQSDLCMLFVPYLT